MSDQLSRMLGERPWLLADGATGTNLYNMGLVHGQAPDLWNESQPDKVRALHSQMIAAGADIILTNSFGANATRLRLAGAQDRVRELNRTAARQPILEIGDVRAQKRDRLPRVRKIEEPVAQGEVEQFLLPPVDTVGGGDGVAGPGEAGTAEGPEIGAEKDDAVGELAGHFFLS